LRQSEILIEGKPAKAKGSSSSPPTAKPSRWISA